MKSITIHGMDDVLDRTIRERATADNTSLNKTIKRLLEESLGLHGARDHRAEFMDLFGTWSRADREEFDAATEEMGQVDPGDWE